MSVSLPKFSSEDNSTEAHSELSIRTSERVSSPEGRTPLLVAHTKVVPSPGFAESADDLMLEWMSLDRIALHPRDNLL